MWGGFFRPYVSVAERRRRASVKASKLTKGGQKLSPIQLESKTIAHTFWGKAWCDHLESYSDYENRLPRGRSYIRNGFVIDLQIEPGKVNAMVQGSDLYKQNINIKSLQTESWNRIKSQCTGKIDSLVELLQGHLSGGVMGVITQKDHGLFPKPAEIKLECSCPDWAEMCKHIAAVLYGVGARLDEKPELLFLLRGVNHMDLVDQAGVAATLDKATKSSRTKTLQTENLGSVFGIDLSEASSPPLRQASRRKQTKVSMDAKRPISGKTPVRQHTGKKKTSKKGS